MAGTRPIDRIRDDITEIVSILVTGLWLTLLFLGPGNLWLPVMLVGYIVVIPIVSILFDEDEQEDIDSPREHERERERTASAGRSGPEGDGDALEELRRRYAAGELTDEQFERKVEKLLETETIEDAEDHVGRERERETERI